MCVLHIRGLENSQTHWLSHVRKGKAGNRTSDIVVSRLVCDNRVVSSGLTPCCVHLAMNRPGREGSCSWGRLGIQTLKSFACGERIRYSPSEGCVSKLWGPHEKTRPSHTPSLWEPLNISVSSCKNPFYLIEWSLFFNFIWFEVLLVPCLRICSALQHIFCRLFNTLNRGFLSRGDFNKKFSSDFISIQKYQNSIS